MHENREISSTPWSDDQGRSAKATNQTADTHVPEKSDCAVLPVNQPNKGGQSSAEAGEGRAQTKENIVQSHMHPTQSGKRMSQGLDGVRKVAKERKQERFTALLHHLNVDLLRDSFYALQRKASPGVDGVTWQEYETGLEDRLVDLHSRVHRGAYRAKPSRRVFIPKADGRQRPLGIAALEDKIVQQAVVTILNQIYEVDFKGFSYGFRPGRSPHQALDALTVGIQRKRVNWVLDADIRGFFDNLSHEWMMKFIEHRVADRRILRLIRKWLKAGVSEDGQWSETKLGIPQGAVVSPLIANVYLHYLFDLWADVWRKKVAKGDVIVVRYADDLLLLGHDAPLVQLAIRCTRKVLGGLQQRLREPVARPVPGRYGSRSSWRQAGAPCSRDERQISACTAEETEPPPQVRRWAYSKRHPQR